MRPSIGSVLQTLALGVATVAAAPTSNGAAQVLSVRENHKHSHEHQAQAEADGIKPSYDITSCPGYKIVGEPQQASGGFTANLELAGEACNAYGVDIKNLTLAVVYEKPEQLHVHLYDTAKNQFQLPNGFVFDRPGDDPSKDATSTAEESHLEFHHTGDQSPWAFWITRKRTGDIIFDTRSDRIPTYDEPMHDTETHRNTTAMPAHPMIFENQYLQLSSVMEKDASVYGLGEYIAGGFRRNPDATLQPFFTLDAGNPVDSNEYGYHPVYMEARENDEHGVQTHAVYHQNTAGLDVILRPKVIQYRAIGGTLDFRFFSGDKAKDSDKSKDTEAETADKRSLLAEQRDAAAQNSTMSTSMVNSAVNTISQYVSFIGKPQMISRWNLGYHMLRWGYDNSNQTLEAAKKMREADVPLEVLWNDIDILDSFRDFTTAPHRYGKAGYQQIFDFLKEHKQHYIPIVDAGIPAAPTNESDSYAPGRTGEERDVFIKNANGTDYIGQVWPGFARWSTFVDDNAQQWWSEVVRNYSQIVDFSGIWLDMNEISSFCIGSCGSGQNLSTWFGHEKPASVAGWPEGYNNNTSGNSGNITIDGKSTFDPKADGVLSTASTETTGSAKVNSSDYHYSLPTYNYQNDTQRYLNVPPYAIHNGIHTNSPNLVDNLNLKTVAMEAIAGDMVMYDYHNFWGTRLAINTWQALKDLKPKERPFLITRSTYAGAGQKTHHWLGDNYSTWNSMWASLQGILQFQLFGIPFVGADTCGFNRNSDEELCNRWQMMNAMISPFFRQHNTEVSIGQEPFQWDSVAKGSRIANYKRNELLPYYYSVLARSSETGSPAVRTLWYEFPETFSETKNTDSQLLFGDSLLVTPVLEPAVKEVKGYFPSAGGKWRSVFSYEALDVAENKNVTIPAPLSTINAHLRPGSAILTYSEPKYTTAETAEGPMGVLVNLNNKNEASGNLFIDDGITDGGPNSTVTLKATQGSLAGSFSGEYQIPNKVNSVIVLGVEKKPENVKFADKDAQYEYNDDKQLLKAYGFEGDANADWKLTWE
ncbi:unnamed protein product [Sympodiomycopsis kandeliae]